MNDQGEARVPGPGGFFTDEWGHGFHDHETIEMADGAIVDCWTDTAPVQMTEPVWLVATPVYEDEVVERIMEIRTRAGVIEALIKLRVTPESPVRFCLFAPEGRAIADAVLAGEPRFVGVSPGEFVFATIAGEVPRDDGWCRLEVAHDD